MRVKELIRFKQQMESLRAELSAIRAAAADAAASSVNPVAASMYAQVASASAGRHQHQHQHQHRHQHETSTPAQVPPRAPGGAAQHTADIGVPLPPPMHTPVTQTAAGQQQQLPQTSAFPTDFTAALAGTALSPYDLSRFNDLEASQRATANAQKASEASMVAWSATHADTIEALLSQALTGRWVGVVGGGSENVVLSGNTPTGGAGVLVTWQHQAANTHAECYKWSPHTHAITVAEPGVYEVALGLWPPTPGLCAELQVDATKVKAQLRVQHMQLDNQVTLNPNP